LRVIELRDRLLRDAVPFSFQALRRSKRRPIVRRPTGA
jgi:hypothetical protein